MRAGRRLAIEDGRGPTLPKRWTRSRAALPGPPGRIALAVTYVIGLTASAAIGLAAPAAIAQRWAAGAPGAGWFPPDTEMVLRIRYQDMRTSPLFRRLMTSRPMFHTEVSRLERFASRAGIEPARDLDFALVAGDGREGGNSVALIRGALDTAALAARLGAGGSVKSSCGAAPCWVLPADKADAAHAAAGETAVAFPGPGMALVGTRAWVAQALEGLAGKKSPGKLSVPMQSLLTRMDEQATLWAASGSSRAAARAMRRASDASQLDPEDLESIQSLLASVWITDVVRVDSEAGTATPEEADILAATLRALVAVGGVHAAASDPDLAATLRSVKISRTGSGVRVRAEIPAPIASRL